MILTRREALQGLATGGAASIIGGPALAQGGRVLQVKIPANSLGAHIPYMAALNEILPKSPGYAVPAVERVNSNRIITQSILSGTVEVGAGDPIGVLRAVEAGANLKIVGYAFSNTSLVFVVNGDKVKTLKDLLKPDVNIAVNSKGDFTHTLLMGPLLEAKIDPTKINTMEIGGSGARVRALLAGRVDGIPAHIDQARSLAKQGNYQILVEPAKEYETFIAEVWVVGGDWLEKKENQQAVVDLNKATISAFRRTHEDFAWFNEMYRKHGTAKEMKEGPDEEVRAVWEMLAKEVRCWPVDSTVSLRAFEKLLPIYKAADAIQGTVDLAKVIEPRYAEEALKSLK